MQAPLVAPPNVHHLDRTTWSQDGAAYKTALQESNIFFAPRPLEGIGMSFLGAMAQGHCVVAPNAPTMNEYISNGTNGLLYEPGLTTRIDLSDANRIGVRARETVQRGHQRWLTSLPALMDFITTPTATLRAASASLIAVRNDYAPDPPSMPNQPLISVVTVCRNSRAVLAATMRSVIAQGGCDFEYVVVDGASTDGSIDIIEDHAEHLAAWRSEPDAGPYDAMNKSLDLVRGVWVLFMNAGDTFASEDALRRMVSAAPPDADVIHGHHIFRMENGSDELRRTAGFETTWSRLRRADILSDWLAGIPGHQATAVRADLLRRLRFDTRFKIAADHDLLFRARSENARFFNCDELIAIYVEGGLSTRQFELCKQEMAEIARHHGGEEAAQRVTDLFRPVVAKTSHSHVTTLGRSALAIIAGLERLSPAMARSAERLVRSPAARRVARYLRGREAGRRG